MAVAAFADAPVDAAVLEVGIGGSWDATNVADGAVAVITPVSIDHVAYLGDTVEKIATDKAGIIKPGAVAVLAEQSADAARALLRRVAAVGASVVREGVEFGVTSRELAVGGQLLSIRGLLGDYQNLFLPLFGSYQAGNAACALAAVEAFSGGEPAALDTELVAQAFAEMSSPGRLEIVRRSPLVLIDAAHNPAGMAAAASAVGESFGAAESSGAGEGLGEVAAGMEPEVIAVLAVSADKDVAGILDALEPRAAAVVVTVNSSSRSMPAADLAELARPVFGPDRVHVAARLDDAIEIAVGLADAAAAGLGPIILITGSVFTAGDARLLLTGSGPAGDAP
jgi:dihydrofolate synthase / folylpolyglutamate synthase